MPQKMVDYIKEHIEVFISVICAFLILLFTTRSSFLYMCNNWDDVNSYFSMGKGMMNGMVIYRDLYDQKGPYLYLLYGIAYLISHRTFLGVFIFEVIAAAIFLLYGFKTIAARSNKAIAGVLLPILAAGVYSSWSFYKGGAAEEFCLPMFAYSLYALDSILRDRFDKVGIRKAFAIAGICAGITAQIKYTMLGFYFGWFLIAVIYCIGKCGGKDSFRLAIRFILFACIPSIPWFIYFLATGSFDDWFRCYIYNNLFFYSKVEEVSQSVFSRLYELAKVLLFLIEDSFSYFMFIIPGVFLQLFMEKGILKRLAMPVMFGLTFLVIFFGGNTLAYYSIPLMVFAIWGAAYIAQAIYKLYLRVLKKSLDGNSGESGINAKSFAISAFVFTAVLALSTIFAANNCVSKDYRHMDKDSFWLFKAASYLEEGDTLVNLGGLDVGLYTVTGIVPTCEYFQTNGIGLPTLFEEQGRYVSEGATEYIIAVADEPWGVHEHYELVESFYSDEPGYEETYFLYRKKQ
ncbi:MAG: hypothetical protein J6I68_13900 [Butyrivibrio sp.]|uniref:hypothetical protein n=1 Tax=Butyrivibrio sp. TaxID=28121 RepID=UPI001B789F19|nr:hypothetical protein [Butyrivibrio sp.]MBP3784333.1 hypothetical protein [Butyrivibrio sp.]MBP3814230.1 hypothetical protein [Butyrivibrio sp.]